MLLILAIVIATAWLTFRFIGYRDRRARVQRAARAKGAERAARGVLERAGFRVRGQQVRRGWSLIAAGKEVRFDLVADYVVERGGRLWIAEVKTGERALDLRFGPTRRQLLEYREAFGVSGVLLVDAEGNDIREVCFPKAGGRGGSRKLTLLWFALGLALGAAGCWLWAI